MPNKLESVRSAIVPAAVALLNGIREIEPEVEYPIPFCPHFPHPKQERFLAHDEREGLYGGAAGGGKSDALLMAALEYVDTPGYAALLLRRTFPQLAMPGGLMDRAHQWFGPTRARWNGQDKRWRFPSGASISFGYLATEMDKYQYQSSEHQYVAYDELSQFTESQYTYLFSRLRRLRGVEIPLRMRAGTNPGGVGHEWVKKRFIDPYKSDSLPEGRFFTLALLQDNPSLDQEEYEASLMELDPITRAQLLAGNWDVVPGGKVLNAGMFTPITRDEIPSDNMYWCRFWDMAATEKMGGSDPDYTVGFLLGLHLPTQDHYIGGLVRERKDPAEIEGIVLATIRHDAMQFEHYMARMEQEPGSSGKTVIFNYKRELKGVDFAGVAPSGSKAVRLVPAANHAGADGMWMVAGEYVDDMILEFTLFPDVAHDDQVDAFSGAFTALQRVADFTPTRVSYPDESEQARPDDPRWDPYAEQDGMLDD